MIESGTVITLLNGFVTADKLNPNQFIKSVDSEVFVDRISHSEESTITVKTKYYDITSSFLQYFFQDEQPIFVLDLKVGDMIDTVDGQDEIISIEYSGKVKELKKLILKDKSGSYLANGFVVK